MGLVKRHMVIDPQTKLHLAFGNASVVRSAIVPERLGVLVDERVFVRLERCDLIRGLVRKCFLHGVPAID